MSGKRLRLGSGDVADRGGWGFAAGAERLWRPGISNGEKGAMGWTKDPHLGKRIRDVELLQWTTSSGKRLSLGIGEVVDRGGWGFTAGAERLWWPGISNGKKGVMGRGEA